MAKQRNAEAVQAKYDREHPEETAERLTGVFTSSNGYKVPYHAISRWILDDFISSKVELLPPEKVIISVTGEEFRQPHDAETTKTPEEQIAWDTYLAAQEKLNNEWGENLLKLLVVEGVDLDVPLDGEWAKRRRFYGRPVPEDDMERKFAFIRAGAFENEEDATNFIAEVMAISAAKPEAAQAIKDSFRAAIQEATTQSLPKEGK